MQSVRTPKEHENASKNTTSAASEKLERLWFDAGDSTRQAVAVLKLATTNMLNLSFEPEDGDRLPRLIDQYRHSVEACIPLIEGAQVFLDDWSSDVVLKARRSSRADTSASTLELSDALVSVLDAHRWARDLLNEALETRDKSSPKYDPAPYAVRAATRAQATEETAMLAICAYRPRSAAEHAKKAAYLWPYFYNGELDDEHFEAILKSVMEGADGKTC